MMHYRRLAEVIGVVSLLALASAPAQASSHLAKLTGYQEVPAISTPGAGKCRVQISDDHTTVTVALDYSDVEDVQQAHIHFAQKSVNGGIFLFLCSNLGNGPAGTPLCPESPGTVERTLTSADVIGGASAQGIDAGELEEVIEAIRANTTYCNVHSAAHPGGEIRGQLK
jgi:CHRD domain-containing protein